MAYAAKKYPPNKDTNIAQHRVIAIWKAATPSVFPMNVPIKTDKPHKPIMG